MSALRLAARRAVADAVPLLLVLVLVAVTAALAAAAPRLRDRTADEALQEVLAGAEPAARELTVRSTNGRGLRQLEVIDRQARRTFDDTLRGLLGSATVAVTTPRYESYRWPSGELFRPRPFAWLKLRYETGLLDAVRWVEGAAPAAVGSVPVDGEPGSSRVPRIEVALDADVARRLDMAEGDEVLLRPLTGQLGRGGPVVVAVTGLFEPTAPQDEVWGHDPLVLEPGRETNSQGELVALYASALVADADAVKAAAQTVDHEWHYPLRTGEIEADEAADVLAGLQRFASRGFSLETEGRVLLGTVPDFPADSGLRELLTDYQLQSGTAEAVAAVGLTGLLLVALLVLGFAARLLAERRAPGMAVARARGASWPQLLAVQAGEALAVAGPAALVGYAAARALVPARGSAASAWLAGAVAAVAVVLVTAAARQVVAELTTRRRPWARVPVRLLLESAVVLAAVGGVLLLRERGVATSPGPVPPPPGEETGGADPLLAAVPLLVALAAGLLALRLLDRLVRLGLDVTRRRRGATGYLALAAAGRRSGATAVLTVLLLAGLAFSLFAASVTQTIRQGQEAAAWLAVGADVRLDGPGFSDEQVVEAAQAPGVAALAPALLREGVTVAGEDTTLRDASYVGVDVAAYEDVQADAPDALQADLEALAGGTGDDGGPVPVLVTSGLRSVGEEVVLSLGTGIGDVEARVVGVVDRFPLAGSAGAVVGDLAALREGEGDTLRATSLLAAGDGSAADGLGSAAAAWDTSVEVADRRALLAASRGLPFVGSVVGAFALGFAAVAAYALLAVVLWQVLTARDRMRLLGTLQGLGMGAGPARRVAALELAPVAGLVVVVGTAVGTGLLVLLVPAVSLVTFTGGSSEPDPVVDPVTAGALVAGTLGVVGVAVVVVSAAVRRRRVTELVRTGVDG